MDYWLIVAACCVFAVSCRAQLIQRCPRNRINKQEFIDTIGSGFGVSEIYSVQKNVADYGKASGFLQYSPTTDTVYYFFDTYNRDTSSCEVINVPDANITERREFRPGCDILADNRYAVTEATGKADTRFISQVPNKYFWWFICMKGSVRSFADCNEGFFNLNIRRNFAIKEIDLGGLPWDEIAEDLEDFTGLKMEDVKYNWLGRDCV